MSITTPPRTYHEWFVFGSVHLAYLHSLSYFLLSPWSTAFVSGVNYLFFLSFRKRIEHPPSFCSLIFRSIIFCFLPFFFLCQVVVFRNICLYCNFLYTKPNAESSCFALVTDLSFLTYAPSDL